MVSGPYSFWSCFPRRSCAALAVVVATTFTPVSAQPQEVTVVVVPFTNVTQQAEDAWIAGGIAETVSIDLRTNGLRVVDQAAVRDALATATGGPASLTDERALDVGRRLGATLLVGGGYQRVDEQLRITAWILDVQSGQVVESARVDGTLTDLFSAQDRVVAALAKGLTSWRNGRHGGQVGPAGSAAPAAPTPTDTTGTLRLPTDLRQEVSPGDSPVRRAGGGFAIAGRPTATARRTTQPPSVDGRLDDPVWRDVAPITRFVQTSPADGAPATEETEVWIAYDRDNLYFAFYAHYSDPRIMRANRSERDETRGDDQMSVLFDPFLDQQRAYLFSVNAYGVPGDAIVNASGGTGRSSRSVGQSSGGSSGGGSGSSGSRGSGSSNSGFGIRGDASWDALFEARGGIVDDGWTAEMAIPFKSLRYPARAPGESHRWGFQISRNIREKSESLVWSPVSRDIAGLLTQMGALDGLTDLSTSRNLEMLPTFTGVQVGSLDTENGRFREGDPLGQMGLGVKYGVTSNLTLDFTYNPDFSQIESDQPQVEVNQRFALFFAEQRPFFLEGQDEAPGRLDDSSDPAFGRTAQSLIGRVRYDLFADSYVGAIMTAREFDTDYNRVGGLDGRFRLGRTHNLSFMAVASDHRDSTNGDLSGPVVEVDFTRQGRNLSYAVSHSSIDPEFRTETGFVPRVDIRRTDANARYRWWPEGTLINWGPSFTYLRNHNHAGELEDEQFRGDVNFEFVRSFRFSGGVTRDLERFNGVDFHKTGYSFSGLISTQQLSVNASMNRGDGIFFSDSPFLGRSTAGSVGLFYRPTSRLRTELRTIFSRFVDPAADEDIFDVKIFRWRATYQFSDRLLLRHIMEHNTLSGTLGNNVLLTYRVNAGTVAFLGYDDRYQQGLQIDEGFFPTTRLERTNRAFFTKIAYLFRY
jgi:TolB-like protein